MIYVSLVFDKIYYKLLQSGQTVIAVVYSCQIQQLDKELITKRPHFAMKRNKVIILYDNTRPDALHCQHKKPS